MREIKFRGKDVDNRWRFGYLLKDKKLFYISVPRTNFGVVNYVIDDHTTIGQYTGLKDENGVDIYEGDKVKAKFYGKEVNGEIGFSNGCFLLWNSCVSDNQLFIFNDIEVIGNIYENKELLKKEGK